MCAGPQSAPARMPRPFYLHKHATLCFSFTWRAEACLFAPNHKAASGGLQGGMARSSVPVHRPPCGAAAVSPALPTPVEGAHEGHLQSLGLHCPRVGQPGLGASECPGAGVGTKLLNWHGLQSPLDLKPCDLEEAVQPRPHRPAWLTHGTQGLPQGFRWTQMSAGCHCQPGTWLPRRDRESGPPWAPSLHPAARGQWGAGGGSRGLDGAAEWTAQVRGWKSGAHKMRNTD